MRRSSAPSSKRYSSKAYFRLRDDNVALRKRVAELEARLQETDSASVVRASGRGSAEDARFTLLRASAPQMARAVLAKNLDHFAGVQISESGLRLQVQRTKRGMRPVGELRATVVGRAHSCDRVAANTHFLMSPRVAVVGR